MKTTPFNVSKAAACELSRIAGYVETLVWMPSAKLMDMDTLISTVAAADGAPENGVSWRASTRASTRAVTELLDAGLLLRTRNTKGSSVRLASDVVFAMAAEGGISPAKLIGWLRRLDAAPKVATRFCGPLVPSTALARTRRDMERLDETMLPCLMLGWIKRHVATDQSSFGLAVTAPGRAAAPDSVPSIAFDWAAFGGGSELALARFTRRTGGTLRDLPRLLVPHWLTEQQAAKAAKGQ